jgi:hypothetical protein
LSGGAPYRTPLYFSHRRAFTRPRARVRQRTLIERAVLRGCGVGRLEVRGVNGLRCRRAGEACGRATVAPDDDQQSVGAAAHCSFARRVSQKDARRRSAVAAAASFGSLAASAARVAGALQAAASW